MSLNSISPGVPPPVQQATRAEPTGNEAQQGEAAAAASDEALRSVSPDLKLSDSSAKVRAVTQTPPVDMARLEEITAAIKDGSYQVDPKEVASRMLAMEAQLSGK